VVVAADVELDVWVVHGVQCPLWVELWL
jgi:hypothetical protein